MCLIWVGLGLGMFGLVGFWVGLGWACIYLNWLKVGTYDGVDKLTSWPNGTVAVDFGWHLACSLLAQTKE